MENMGDVPSETNEGFIQPDGSRKERAKQAVIPVQYKRDSAR